MKYDNDQIAAKLRRWETYLNAFTLPSWDELPEMGLYMEQVVALLMKYLNFLPLDEHGQAAVTASTINNYVRLKIMPPPCKKRYYRAHIAYLIMICTLKQSVNMAYVQKMIPMGISEDELRTIYDGYVQLHKASCDYFIEQVREKAKAILRPESEEERENAVASFVSTTAVIAGFSKLLTEKIVRLELSEEEEADEREANE